MASRTPRRAGLFPGGAGLVTIPQGIEVVELQQFVIGVHFFSIRLLLLTLQRASFYRARFAWGGQRIGSATKTGICRVVLAWYSS